MLQRSVGIDNTETFEYGNAVAADEPLFRQIKQQACRIRFLFARRQIMLADQRASCRGLEKNREAIAVRYVPRLPSRCAPRLARPGIEKNGEGAAVPEESRVLSSRCPRRRPLHPCNFECEGHQEDLLVWVHLLDRSSYKRPLRKRSEAIIPGEGLEAAKLGLVLVADCPKRGQIR